MISLSGQKTVNLTVVIALAMVLGAAVLGLADSRMMPWSFVMLAGIALMVACAATNRVSFWIWLWVLSYGLLDRWFWVLELEGFFNLSIPRIMFMAVTGMFFVYFLVRRRPLHFDGSIMWIMLALLVYVAASATATGWTSPADPLVRSAPYFRYFVGLVFPFTVFFLMYNCARDGRQIRWALVAVTVYGFYSLFIAYCQGLTLLEVADLEHLIWPGYIKRLDLPGMIHPDRARGAFPAAGPQAIFLVFLFYADLYLIRRLRGPYRIALAAQAVLVLPALVFTGIRAGYVAFALGGIIWCVWGLGGWRGWSKLSIAALAMALGVLMQWGAITGAERIRGGIAQRRPIVARALLLKQTMGIVAAQPVFGAGFGHFVDAQRSLEQDAGGLALLAPATLVEHNVFLNMAAETGLVGLGLLIALYLALFRRSVKVWKRIAPTAEGFFTRSFIALFWVMLANYLASAMFRDLLWDPFANALLWSLAGLTLGLGRVAAPAQAEASTASPQTQPA